MKMNEYDVLEECLQALDNGQTVNEVLARYPGRERELRPLLNTAIQARSLGDVPVPVQFQKRDRNRLIRRAAEMRESKRSQRRMIPLFPRLAMTLGVVAALVLSGTGLVSASSGTIPGDQLYPVKRTWEGVRLMFVFSPQGREILQSQYQQERLDEIDELLVKGRGSTPIVFSGLVTQQQDGSWMISGIPVAVNKSTVLPSEAITASAPVVVSGVTRSDGIVEAQQIELLGPLAPLPPFEPSENSEHNNENTNSVRSAPTVRPMPSMGGTSGPATQSAGSQNQYASYEFSGVVESMQNGIWTINGQTVHVDQATIGSNVRVGSTVKFQGYYDDNGQFIVSNLVLASNGDWTTSTSHHNNNNNSGENNNSSPTQGSGEKEGGGGGNENGGGGGSSGGVTGTPSGGDH